MTVCGPHTNIRGLTWEICEQIWSIYDHMVAIYDHIWTIQDHIWSTADQPTSASDARPFFGRAGICSRTPKNRLAPSGHHFATEAQSSHGQVTVWSQLGHSWVTVGSQLGLGFYDKFANQ